jgi:hypothetical protein
MNELDKSIQKLFELRSYAVIRAMKMPRHRSRLASNEQALKELACLLCVMLFFGWHFV